MEDDKLDFINILSQVKCCNIELIMPKQMNMAERKNGGVEKLKALRRTVESG